VLFINNESAYSPIRCPDAFVLKRIKGSKTLRVVTYLESKLGNSFCVRKTDVTGTPGKKIDFRKNIEDV